MAKLIPEPAVIKAAGNLPKIIEEYVGRVNSGHDCISIARMKSPSGWKESGQSPEFTEFTLVLKGVLHAATSDSEFEIQAGQCFIAEPGEWVQYSTPGKEGAEYIAVCLPAFSPETVHRNE